jgi:hypothetical protein
MSLSVLTTRALAMSRMKRSFWNATWTGREDAMADSDGYTWVCSRVFHVGRDDDTGAICSVTWDKGDCDLDAGSVGIPAPPIEIKVGDAISVYTAGLGSTVKRVIVGEAAIPTSASARAKAAQDASDQDLGLGLV